MKTACSLVIIVLALAGSGCRAPQAPPAPAPDPAQLQARLQSAIDDNDYEGVRDLLAAGARVDQPLPSRHHPLGRAVVRENVSIVRLLLKAGADPNRLDGLSSAPPLAGAVWAHSRALVDELVRSGANPNQRFGPQLRHTILGQAAQAWGGAAIGALTEAGADPNAWDQVPVKDYPLGYRGRAEGYTPLMLAAQAGQELNAVLLLLGGADPELRNERGQRAVDLMGDPTAELRKTLLHPQQYMHLNSQKR